MSDVLAVLTWWLLLQAMGWVALPLVFRLLRWLPDRGYSVAKPAGLLLGNYVLWLLGTLGWLRNTEGGILLAFGLVALFGAWVYQRWDDGSKLIEWLRAHKQWIVAYEALFLTAFVAWAVFRAHNPDLSTTEKPMEFAFMNAIHRSPAFPPPDPWLSGFTISYYYFGYVMMSTLTKLSGVASGVAFSLSNALWFALTAAGAFGIAANLVAASKRATHRAIVVTGLLGALFVPVLSNFEGPLEVAHANDVGPSSVWRLFGTVRIEADWVPAPLRDNAGFWRWLDIQDINTEPVVKSEGVPTWPPRYWWWWRASRVVHDYPLGSDRSTPAEYQELIDEFPFFSFLLGDMHPHVLALPYALLSLALAFNLFRMPASGDAAYNKWRQWFWEAAPIAVTYPVFLGALSFLNTWDFPIHVFVVALAWGLGRWLASPRRELWLDALVALMVCGLIGVAAYLPFYVGFRSQAAGIVPNIYNPTRWQQFFVMFGPFLLIGAMFVLALIAQAIRQRRMTTLGAALGSLGGGAGIVIVAGVLTAVASAAVLAISSGARAKLEEWSGITATRGIRLEQVVLQRLSEFSVPLLLGTAIAAIVLILRSRSVDSQTHPHPPDEEVVTPFALMLFAVGALLAFAVEYVYLLDHFGTRMNTVFKLYYQAWVVWGVAAAYAVYYLWQSTGRLTSAVGRTAFASVLAVSIAGGLVYPLLAIPDKIDRGITPTLDARAPTRQSSPNEVAAIEWLERNAGEDPVILEAEGQSYVSGTSRLSAWTGLPSVLGWVGHESQWRGSIEDISPRQPDIDRIYQTTDRRLAMELIEKYGIAYVYVGPNEIGKYSPTSLAKFGSIMEVAFQQGDSTLYRRRDISSAARTTQ